MTNPEASNFGRYQLVERIAIGGMAEIFIAKIVGAMGFEKQVVIKRILPQFAADTEFLRMFVTEAKLVCHLEHPNIVQVYELGELGGQYFIAMEHVNGIDGRQLWRTLAKRKQRLPAVLALLVVGEFLKGLDYAHRAVGPDDQLLGVVHRDVSPSNILISYRGDVKIGDFGIALVQQESKTQAGVLKGKYGYMSPEQVAGLAVDQRSDIFAAGIVLAELLLGRRLFLGRSDFETLDRVLNVRLDVLEQHEEAFPATAVAIVRQALQREPDDRYPTAREFHDAIMDCLFQESQRVTTETLATFIGQHVAPHLVEVSGERLAVESSVGPRASAGPRMPAAAELVSLGREPDSRSVVNLDLEAEAGRPDPRLPQHQEPLEGAAVSGHGSFASWPELSGLDLSADDQLQTTSPVGAAPGFEGAGEELDLSSCDEEEVFFPETDQSINLRESSAPSLVGEQPMFQAQLTTASETAAEAEAAHASPGGSDPDFAGRLSNRTVLKVIFRFAVVKETGLLTLSGPELLGDDHAEHLEWISGLRRATGVVPAAQSVRTCEVHLQQGVPHLVAADRSEESLVAHLLAVGEVDRSRVERALKSQRHRGAVAALLAEGLVTPLQVSRFVTSFVQKSVTESFDWTEGDFAFFRGRDCSHEAFPTGLGPLSFIWQGTEAIRAETLEAYFRPLAGRPIGANPAPPALIEDFPHDPRLRGVYNALGQPRSPEVLVAGCVALGSRPEVMRALYTLLESEVALLQ